MLYLYHHADRHWNLPETPSVGNHFELIDTDNISEYDWDVCSDYASDKYGGEEEDGDWGDFVESNGGSSKYYKYDPTNPVHVKHKGFEDQRPEHVAWLLEETARLEKAHWDERKATLADMKIALEELTLNIENLQSEIDHNEI